MHGDDRLPALPQGPQQLDDRLLRRRVDALEGLVHEVDLGVLDERTGEEDALLLAAGELADLAAGELGHADLLERLPRGRAILGARPPHPAEPPVPAHQHDVEDARREVPVDAAALRHVGDELALLRVRPPVHERLPGGRLHHPEDRPHQRRLAGPVGADDRHQHALRHLEVDVPEHRLLAVGNGQIGHLDGVHPSSPSTIVSTLCRTMPM